MTGADIKIYNNTFVANNCHGFVNDVPSGYGTIFTVKNNIFICTATSGYTALYTGSPITHSNNCFWRTATGSPVFVNNNGSYYYESTITSYEATAIGEDPLLVNRAGFNYHLSSGSPCRDEGANLGLTQDFDGYVVPYNSVPDIGAFEYGAGPPEEENVGYSVIITGADVI